MSSYPPNWDDEFSFANDEHRLAFLEHLKSAGLYDLVMEMTAKTEEERLRDRERGAPYLSNLEHMFLGEDEWSEWGFVIYRTCCYGPADEARWAQFRARFDRILDDQVAKYHNYHPKLDRAIELRRNIWIEDPDLDNASPEDISRLYAQLKPSLSCGYRLPVCLMVTPESVDSVLNSPLPSSAPIKCREALPFVIAVDEMAHQMPFSPPPKGEDEDSPYEDEDRPSFRVAVESLMDELYGAYDNCGLLVMTDNIKHEKDIWFDWAKGGVRHCEDCPRS